MVNRRGVLLATAGAVGIAGCSGGGGGSDGGSDGTGEGDSDGTGEGDANSGETNLEAIKTGYNGYIIANEITFGIRKRGFDTIMSAFIKVKNISNKPIDRVYISGSFKFPSDLGGYETQYVSNGTDLRDLPPETSKIYAVKGESVSADGVQTTEDFEWAWDDLEGSVCQRGCA